MANKKDLRGNVSLMREVAQLLSEWADDLESSLTKKGGRKNVVADAAPTEEPVKGVTEPVVSVAETTPAEELTYAKVRKILGDKSAAGYSTQVQALINSFGALKLSEVDPVHYPALLEAVDALGGDPDAG